MGLPLLRCELDVAWEAVTPELVESVSAQLREVGLTVVHVCRGSTYFLLQHEELTPNARTKLTELFRDVHEVQEGQDLEGFMLHKKKAPLVHPAFAGGAVPELEDITVAP